MISIFKRKNPEDMKPLTEADIQRKLYGNFQGTGSEEIKLKGKEKKQAATATTSTTRTSGPVLALEQLPKVYEPEALAMDREAKDLFDTRSFEKPYKIKETRAGHDVLTELNQTLHKKQSAKDALLKELDQNHIRPQQTVSFSPVKQIFTGILSLLQSAFERISVKVLTIVAAGSVALLAMVLVFHALVSLSQRHSESSVATPRVRVSRSAEVTTTSATTTETRGVRGPYSIQVCIYDNAAQARDLVQKFKGQGLDAFFDTSRTSKGKTIYRVHIGNYKNIQEAQTSLRQLQTSRALSLFPDSFIKKIAS